MNTSRRDFLKRSALAMAGTSVVTNSLFSCSSAKANEIVAVQLYCVREDMKSDPLATLTKLAEMGYKHVEHANYEDRKFYGYTAPEFKKLLKMQLPWNKNLL